MSSLREMSEPVASDVGDLNSGWGSRVFVIDVIFESVCCVVLLTDP